MGGFAGGIELDRRAILEGVTAFDVRAVGTFLSAPLVAVSFCADEGVEGVERNDFTGVDVGAATRSSCDVDFVFR